MVSVLVASVTLLAFMGTVLTAPINNRLSWMDANNARNEQDVRSLKDNVSYLRSEQATTSEAVKAINAQFVSQSHIRNLMMQKAEMRDTMIWQKVAPGTRPSWPVDNYYPVTGEDNGAH